MKAILIIAVLAFAAQAHLSTPAYHLGFSEKLGLTSQQLQHASTCFNSFKTVVHDIKNVTRSTNSGIASVLKALLTTVQDVENKLKVDCVVYLQDLAQVLFRNTSGDIKGTALRNFNRYTPQIIQQVAFYFDALVAGDHYQAGQVEAYILQVLFGLEQPKGIDISHFNSSRFVQLNVTRYLKEFFPGYFTALGVNNSKAIQDNVECNLNYMNLVELVATASQQFAKNQTVEEKVRLIQSLVFSGVKLYDSCHDAFVFNWEHFAGPFVAAFQNAPVHVVVAIVHNIAVNLPEILQNRVDMAVAILEGEYSNVGRMSAEELVIILRNIIF